MLFVSGQILIKSVAHMKVLRYLNALCVRPDTDKIFGTNEGFVIPKCFCFRPDTDKIYGTNEGFVIP